MGSTGPIQIQIVTPLKMGTHKVKGLLKGLRYISQVFDEEKEQEIQIGAPTDVKHVAHIGCDGGPAVDSPSWMKDFSGSGQNQSSCQSVALDASEAPSDGPDWVSEDSSQRKCRRERQERLKAKHRRHRSMESDLDPDSHGKDGPTKSRPARRHHAKAMSSEGSRSLNPSARDELPDVPKRTRRKKPKDESGGAASRPSRSKAVSASSQPSDDAE